MSTAFRYMFVWVVIQLLLSPGCSTGRQSKLHRETAFETQVVRTDSLLLQKIFQSSRKKTIDIEHIVFDTFRLNTDYRDTFRTDLTLLPQSITRFTVNEQDEAKSNTSVRSGSESSSYLLSSDSLQKEHASDLSLGKWLLLLGVVLLLLRCTMKDR